MYNPDSFLDDFLLLMCHDPSDLSLVASLALEAKALNKANEYKYHQSRSESLRATVENFERKKKRSLESGKTSRLEKSIGIKFSSQHKMLQFAKWIFDCPQVL